MKDTKLIKNIICGILIAVFAIIIIYTGIIMANKAFSTTYDSLPQTDRDAISVIEEIMSYNYTSSSQATVKRFDRPVIIVEKGGIRGNAYVFNLPVTEHEGGLLNMNLGVYAQEILLENSFVLSPYRLSVFTPGLKSLIFQGSSDEVTKVFFAGEQVTVIPYDEASVKNGTFAMLFEQYATIEQQLPDIDNTVPEEALDPAETEDVVDPDAPEDSEEPVQDTEDPENP